MQFSLIQIWEHMGVPAMVVAAVLLAMGIASLAVLIERVVTLRLSRAASRRFAAAIGEDAAAGRISASDRLEGRRSLGPRLREVTEALREADAPEVSR